jgi:hypothetical protein
MQWSCLTWLPTELGEITPDNDHEKIMKKNATVEFFIDVRGEIVSATRCLLPISLDPVARLCGGRINVGIGEQTFARWCKLPIY